MEQYRGSADRQTVILPNQRKKKGKRGFFIFLGLLMVIVLLAVFLQMPAKPVAHGPYVACMYIEGEIGSSNYDSMGRAVGYQHLWTLDQLEQLKTDPDNRGILFYVDSPGGGVYESDELYLAVKEYEKATGRPVYVYMGPYGASGAYYASAAADRIFANRNSLTGSIGITIGTLFDASQLLKTHGVETYTIDTGEMKSAGNGLDPITEEQLQYFQGLVDEPYQRFIDIVSEERNIAAEKVKELADGRLYTAAQAKELGLIDEIGTLDEAVNAMCREHGLWDCQFVDVDYDYEQGMGLSDILYFISGKVLGQQPEAEIQTDKRVSENKTELLKYIYTAPSQTE